MNLSTALHLLVVHRQVQRLVDPSAILEVSKGSTHAVGPPLHVLNLQGAHLEALSALLVLLQSLAQLPLMLLHLQVDVAGSPTQVRIKGVPIGVAFEAVEI